MAEEYKSIHTGADIDAAVSRSLPGGAISQAINAKPNPNLLHNWYFGNPVNQKGESNYEKKTGYTIDRWVITNTETALLVNSADKSISLSAYEGGIPYLQQIIENPTNLFGKTVTLSVLTLTGCFSATSRLPDAFPAGNTLYCNVNGYCDVLATPNTLSVRLKGPVSEGRDFYAVKLELGSEQTLAHQKNGNWVLNEIPDYGEELAKCQRYYLALGNLVRYPATRFMSSEIDFIVPLPVTMRGGTPAMVGTCTVYNGATAQSGFTFSLAAAGVNAMAIRGSKASHGLTSANTYLAVNGVAFDANL